MKPKPKSLPDPRRLIWLAEGEVYEVIEESMQTRLFPARGDEPERTFQFKVLKVRRA